MLRIPDDPGIEGGITQQLDVFLRRIVHLREEVAGAEELVDLGQGRTGFKRWLGRQRRHGLQAGLHRVRRRYRHGRDHGGLPTRLQALLPLTCCTDCTANYVWTGAICMKVRLQALLPLT